MRSEIHVRMRAPYDRIFDLASEIERWPQLLPHYRYVRRLPGSEARFAMGARLGPIPVKWEAICTPMRAERRIEFVHTGGVTKGMWVAWHFEQHGDAFDVSIEHRLELHWPLIGGFAARHIIGPQFIDAIAGRTLRGVKAMAEGRDP